MDDKILDDKALAEMPVKLNPPESGWKKFWRKYKVIIVAVVAVVLVVGIFWFFLSRSSTTPLPQSNNVTLTIKGPDQVTSGNEAQYTITYHNGENADMTNVTLDALYPTGFTFKSATPAPTDSSGDSFNLPIVKAGADASITIRGDLSGSTGESEQIQGILHYSLSNFNSDFEVSQTVASTIAAPNLLLDLNGPVDVVNGQDTTFTATVTNVSGQPYDNLILQLTYPTGFNFTSANVTPTQGSNVWDLGTLDTNGSQSIEITGNFSGENNAEQLVEADLGQTINNAFAAQVTSTADFQIIPSSLALTISNSETNGYVKPGDTVTYKLNYQNNGTIGLSNLVINVTVDSPFVDYAHISAQNAIISGHTLTWKAATLPTLSVLSPDETGSLSFTVPTLSTLPTDVPNQMIQVSANISSDEITTPTEATESDLKLVSTLGLAVTGDYVSGAVPLTVGQSTTFAITFTLTNLSNDLSGTEVQAALPLPSSAWNNVIVPASESSRLSFDPNSGLITWNIGDLSAFTGNYSIPALQVTFQLVLTPAVSDQGKTPVLLNKIQATGTDSFVGQPISSQLINSFGIGNLSDTKLQQSGGRVQS